MRLRDREKYISTSSYPNRTSELIWHYWHFKCTPRDNLYMMRRSKSPPSVDKLRERFNTIVKINKITINSGITLYFWVFLYKDTLFTYCKVVSLCLIHYNSWFCSMLQICLLCFLSLLRLGWIIIRQNLFDIMSFVLFYHTKKEREIEQFRLKFPLPCIDNPIFLSFFPILSWLYGRYVFACYSVPMVLHFSVLCRLSLSVVSSRDQFTWTLF